MGKIFVLYFDQNERFYMCKYCKTHIALEEEYLFQGQLPELSIFGTKLVNVLTDEYEPDHSFESVHCVCCNAKLGYKFVMVEAPDNIFQEGRFLNYLDRLFYWDGNWLRHGATRELVENNYIVEEPPDDEHAPHVMNIEWQPPANANPVQIQEVADDPVEAAEFQNADAQPPVNADPVEAQENADDAQQLVENNYTVEEPDDDEQPPENEPMEPILLQNPVQVADEVGNAEGEEPGNA